MDQIDSTTQPPTLPPSITIEPLSPSDERTWAMLAHLSVLLNLVTGFLGIVAALVIYLVYKNRSRYVAYQSMQSFVFPADLVVWWRDSSWNFLGDYRYIINCSCWLIMHPLSCVISLLPLGAMVYGVIGAIQM